MVQLYKQGAVQYARIKLDGYTGSGNLIAKVTNIVTGYEKSVSLSNQPTNDRFTQITIPMQSWYNDEDLHEGFYILSVRSSTGGIQYATRLAFIAASSSASFTESTYTAYDDNDSAVYEVYEQ